MGCGSSSSASLSKTFSKNVILPIDVTKKNNGQGGCALVPIDSLTPHTSLTLRSWMRCTSNTSVGYLRYLSSNRDKKEPIMTSVQYVNSCFTQTFTRLFPSKLDVLFMHLRDSSVLFQSMVKSTVLLSANTEKEVFHDRLSAICKMHLDIGVTNVHFARACFVLVELITTILDMECNQDYINAWLMLLNRVFDCLHTTTTPRHSHHHQKNKSIVIKTSNPSSPKLQNEALIRRIVRSKSLSLPADQSHTMIKLQNTTTTTTTTTTATPTHTTMVLHRTKVMISYSHKDNAIVLKIMQALKETNPTWDIWIDVAIEEGREWRNDIATAIEQCEYFLFCISSTSVRSQYCCEELLYAKKLDKAVLPLLLEAIDNNMDSVMKLALLRLQCFNFINKNICQGIDSLMAYIKQEADDRGYNSLKVNNNNKAKSDDATTSALLLDADNRHNNLNSTHDHASSYYYYKLFLCHDMHNQRSRQYAQALKRTLQKIPAIQVIDIQTLQPQSDSFYQEVAHTIDNCNLFLCIPFQTIELNTICKDVIHFAYESRIPFISILPETEPLFLPSSMKIMMSNDHITPISFSQDMLLPELTPTDILEYPSILKLLMHLFVKGRLSVASASSSTTVRRDTFEPLM